ncbi:MAG TPA: tRNA dihydrouridine(20/20a) synthase DusA [Hyphomicrobiales bacterium]|nr:tRNA dihydrouridine(20/20a) synthase DusA [Hyphomicrobiales bacterium]
MPEHKFSVAPMMDWTDRHCRYFHRQLTRRARLYTEMLTSAAIIHGDRQRLLAFHPEERPVALQLGGSDPGELAKAAEIAMGFGYDEFNLNCGCPSDRVQAGRFGACLMTEPDLVAACVSSMMRAAGAETPVTVKCRIGVDDQDAEADLTRFVEKVASAGCEVFIIHARKAWLQGLSPKENREVPPLDYERVYRLKARFPELTVVLNGGIGGLGDAARHLEAVDGVMLGRAAYKSPRLLLDVDSHFFADASHQTLSRALDRMLTYTSAELARGTKLASITRHMVGLMNGKPGARTFRRLLTEESVKPGASLEILRSAMDILRRCETQPASELAA